MPQHPHPIGDLRHRLTLEAATRAPDGAGGVIETWAAIAELWADIRDLGGHELYESGGLKSEVTHIVTARPHPDLAPSRRLRKGPRIFEILALRNESVLTDRVTLLCEERDL
jgi:SPP1 family predicted phage head-tail adaptor